MSAQTGPSGCDTWLRDEPRREFRASLNCNSICSAASRIPTQWDVPWGNPYGARSASLPAPIPSARTLSRRPIGLGALESSLYGESTIESRRLPDSAA